jgi:hypothetical protein
MANTLAISTTNLTDSFGWTNGEVIYQQDVSELNRQLLDSNLTLKCTPMRAGRCICFLTILSNCLSVLEESLCSEF